MMNKLNLKTWNKMKSACDQRHPREDIHTICIQRKVPQAYTF